MDLLKRSKSIQDLNSRKISFMTKQDIDSICEKYGIENYIINNDMSIDVVDNVCLSSQELTELPLNFKKVSGDFDCSNNELTSLERCPEEVGGDFQCSYNKLTTLEGSPKRVVGVFDCSNNHLISLKGCKFDFMVINFEYNDITINSLFELEVDIFEKAIEKLDEIDSYIGDSWYEYYFDITKEEFGELYRQYKIAQIIA